MTIATLDLRADAIAEAARVTRGRAVGKGGSDRDPEVLEFDGPLVAVARRSRLRRTLGGRWLLIWRVAFEDAAGRIVETSLVPMLVPIRRGRAASRRRRWIRDVLLDFQPALQAIADDRVATWRAAVAEAHGRFASTRAAREGAIAAMSSREPHRLFQPGLFDRRGDRARRIEDAAAAEADLDARVRIEAVLNAGRLTPRRGELLLVLTS